VADQDIRLGRTTSFGGSRHSANGGHIMCGAI